MPLVSFTQNLQRHVACPSLRVPAGTLREVLEAVFTAQPRVRDYILDERGAVRKHVVVFVDGRQARDRQELSDEVTEDAEVHVMQALSGG